jgi:hypothetical protein
MVLVTISKVLITCNLPFNTKFDLNLPPYLFALITFVRHKHAKPIYHKPFDYPVPVRLHG